MSILNRRQFVSGATALGAASMLAGCGESDPRNFPDRDVKFIIPFAAGGGFDSYVRIVAEPMAAALGGKVNVVPTNVTGAGGGKGVSQLYHSRPDGYTIGILNVPGALVMELLTGTGSFDLEKMTWLGNIGRDPYGVAVGYNSPIRTIDDLRALSARRPLKFTSTGPGSTGRAATLIASEMLGLRSEIISGYKGSIEYIVAAARGDGDAAISSLTVMTGLVQAKVIRVIATFEEKSSIEGAQNALDVGHPELTKIVQLRPVAAPPALPAEIEKRLSDALAKGLRDPGVVAWSDKNHAYLAPESPEQTIAGLHEQMAFINQWRSVLERTT